jgi:hypothetical protein
MKSPGELSKLPVTSHVGMACRHPRSLQKSPSTAQLLIELHGFGGVPTKGIDVSRLTKRMAKPDQLAV